VPAALQCAAARRSDADPTPLPPPSEPAMNIFANTVVTLTFQLYDGEGTLLEETPEPIAYLHGGHSGMLPKLEEALNHKAVGDDVSVTIEPADGFGDYDPDLVKVEGVDRLPADVAVGMQFEAYANPDDPEGSGTVFTVTDIADGKVVLDGNHPWAGRLLRFDCRILDVRPATREELEHGHVHGPGGHHHH
jgi:FKBP-type peptidyl-prolyl cis-trans isomerase SlyD